MVVNEKDSTAAALSPDQHELFVTTDSLLAWLRSRRSVRRFNDQPIPRFLINSLLETAIWAPSAHNRQPWRFIVLESRSSRQALAEKLSEDYQTDLIKDGLSTAQAKRVTSRSYSHILNAPCAILLCLEMAEIDTYPDDERQRAELQTAVQSAALAGGTFLLAAHAAGLACVWLCAPLFAKVGTRISLDLPDTWDPQALILLGYPQEIPKPRPRRPLEEVVTYL